MNTINQLIQNHSLAIVITTLVIYALVWLISRKSSNKQTPPSSKGKVTAYQGQVISLCVLIAIVSGLYWLWATCIRGKHFDLSWLKYVAWGLVAVVPLLLLLRFGFFSWIHDKWKKRKEAKAKEKTEAAAKATTDEKKKKTDDKKEKEKEPTTKKTSLWFWIIILILSAVGFVSYYFQKEIEQWIRSGQWRHLPLWVYLTCGLALFIIVLWVVGKERLGKFLAAAAIITVIAFALNSVTSGFKSVVGEHSGSILTTQSKPSKYTPQVIQITPEHPLQSAYRENWDGYVEYPQSGKVVWLYIPQNGIPIYRDGNLVVDQSRVIRMELGKPTQTLMQRGRDDTGWRFYWTNEGESATVTIQID